MSTQDGRGALFWLAMPDEWYLTELWPSIGPDALGRNRAAVVVLGDGLGQRALSEGGRDGTGDTAAVRHVRQ